MPETIKDFLFGRKALRTAAGEATNTPSKSSGESVDYGALAKRNEEYIKQRKVAEKAKMKGPMKMAAPKGGKK
jgi:hypothetical protein